MTAQLNLFNKLNLKNATESLMLHNFWIPIRLIMLVSTQKNKVTAQLEIANEKTNNKSRVKTENREVRHNLIGLLIFVKPKSI